jgi:ethanolamine ammonia-lyase small subunit
MSEDRSTPTGAPAPDETPDIWSALRQTTAARIGLGRAGNAIPIAEVLKFQQAHAVARDAVHAALDVDALAADIAPLRAVTVSSRVGDRATYLRRPDLGRLLDSECEARLKAMACEPCDVVFVVGDGLSSTAVQRHAAPVIHACRRALADWSIAPVVIARQARVAIADPIGAALGARLSVILIGERPGLTVSDSLGLYMTYGPRPGRRDSERNCISNIHNRGGQSYEQAARTLSWLARESLRRSLSGVDLKDDLPADALAAPTATPQIPER